MSITDEIQRPRGRPAKPDALTPAQRTKRYRDKAREEGKVVRMVSSHNTKGDNSTSTILALQDELKKRDASLIAMEVDLLSTRRKLIEARDQLAAKDKSLMKLRKENDELGKSHAFLLAEVNKKRNA